MMKFLLSTVFAAALLLFWEVNHFWRNFHRGQTRVSGNGDAEVR